jgi:hypothetical protein
MTAEEALAWAAHDGASKRAPAICHTTAESTSNQTIEPGQYWSDEHSPVALIVLQLMRL